MSMTFYIRFEKNDKFFCRLSGTLRQNHETDYLFAKKSSSTRRTSPVASRISSDPCLTCQLLSLLFSAYLYRHQMQRRIMLVCLRRFSAFIG